MTNETETPADQNEQTDDATDPATTEDDATDDEVRTSGHVERTVLHHMVGDGEGGHPPTTVSDVLEDVAAVIDRGGYADVGPRNTAGATVRKSTIRRTFTQLREKGLVERVSALDPAALDDGPYDLGELEDGGDPADPAAYAETTDDARVTDWVLTGAGREEVCRLDARYAAELDDLAARYGRPRGETTDRIDA